MLLPRVSARYAKSILELAVERNVLEETLVDMKLVSKTLVECPDLNVMLKSPVIKADKKKRIFSTVFKDQISTLSAKFFEIIIRKSREQLILDITWAFIKQYKDYKNINIVYVETASPLNEENRKSIMEYLKTQIKDEIELIENIKEELIGGVVIRMKDVQIDASVRSNIAKLEREFSKDLYTIKF
ncbi:MAG: ATP synthase F1 subunit delta [Vicingaceae bacterium]